MGILRYGRLPGPTGKATVGLTLEPGMFKNIALETSSFQSTGTYAFPADLTADGYPKNGASLSANVFGTVLLASNLLQSEQMVLKFKGTGRVKLGRGAPGFTGVSASAGSIVGGTGFDLTLDGTDARCVFSFATSVPKSVTLAFVSGVTFSGNFSSLVLCRLSDEAAIDAATKPEDYFREDYIAIYRAMNPKIVRTMGWANPNFGNVSQFRYIPKWNTSWNISSVSWAPGAWAGTATQGTVGATTPYTCASPPDATGSYVDKEMIHVQWNVAASGVPITINSGGRGVKNVIVGTGANTGIAQAYVGAGEIGTLTYDAITDAFWYQVDGQSNCVPYELQAAFANLANAHLWTNVHPYIDDASVTSITTVLRDRLAQHLLCYLEYGNEPWNNGFPQAHFLDAQGTALGFSSSNARRLYGAQGLRIRKMMGLASAAWAPRATSQLRRVMNVHQLGYGDVANVRTYLLNGTDLNGTSYPAYAAKGFTNYDTQPNRPIDYCDVLSYATYFQGAQTNDLDLHYVSAGSSAIATGGPPGWTTGLVGAADAYAAGGAGNIAAAFDFMDWDIRQGTANGSPGSATMLAFNSGASLNLGSGGVYSAWETAAASYDTPRAGFGSPLPPLTVELYEGAMQSWYPDWLATCSGIGLSSSSAVTFNIGSSPSVNWTAHPLENDSIVGFATTGALPSNVGAYNSSTDQNKFFVVNATSNGFDLALTPGGAAITLTGSPTGTHTATGSKYGGSAGRIAKLLDGYKNDQRFYQILLDQFAQFMAFGHSKTPVWFLLTGRNEWAMSTGNIFAAKYKSYDAFVYYNTH